MFKINRKIEYALLALKYISAKKPGQLTSAKEICDLYKAPFDPTSRVLQIMTQNAVLKAEQGSKGGYALVKDLAVVTLKDLSEMIIGDIQIANCLHEEESSCEITCTCAIISPILKLNEDINALFAKITVADLLGSHHPREEKIRSRVTAHL